MGDSRSLLDHAKFLRWLQQAIFLPQVGTLLLISIFIYNIVEFDQSMKSLDHSDQVIAQASKVERLMIDAETGIRGYLVTKDKVFLEPYNQSEASLPTEVDKLSKMIGDNPEQQARLRDLREQSDRVHEQSRKLLAGELPNFKADMMRNKFMMDAVREGFDRFIATEYDLRFQRSQEAKRARRIAITSATALTLFLGILLAIYIRRLMLRLASSYESAVNDLRARSEELFQSREWFSTTLSSIGDAVIVIKGDSTVDFLNPIAERLTGWKLPEAKGKPMLEVFNIINEETRRPAVNPVTRVMKEGVIVGLANHTVLISRQGKEYPIEDSAAPIFDLTKKVRGVVLVFRDVTDKHEAELRREGLTKNLQTAVNNAQEAVNARDEFLSIASHELKTPLTSLKLQNQMLIRRILKGASDKLRPEDLKQMAELADRQITHLARLVDDMLDVSRIATGRMRFEMVKCNLSEIVKNLCSSSQTFFDVPNPQFATSIQDGVYAVCDEMRIQQVLVNLISNALKYGREKPIEVNLTVNAGFARVTVRDHGIGISEEDQSRIFMRFERAVSSANISGLGLGLYISRQIIDAHRGRIGVESKPDQGALFMFEIPMA